MAYSLQNIDNYKSNIENSCADIFERYLDLIGNYMKLCVETLYIGNVDYHKYILMKGIETISHVFRFLLLYTNNLELTYYHCQKSFYYYVEFIGQIGDDNHTFLQLNSKDASLFVYKKTIFDINNEYRKEFSTDIVTTMKMDNICYLLGIYNEMINSVILDNKFIKNDDVLLDNIDSKLSKLKHHLIGLVSVSSSEQCNKKLELIRRFSDNIRINDSSCIQYIDIFTRKLKKHDMSCILFNTKMSNDENNIRMLSTSPLKYINWIFTPLKV